MKRFLPALALALAVAAPASAKEATSLTVCGTNGCNTTKDRETLNSAMEVQPQATPDHSGAFLQVRLAVRAPGQHDRGTMRSQWIPSLGLLRHDDGIVAVDDPGDGRAQQGAARRLAETVRGRSRGGSAGASPRAPRLARAVPGPRARRS